MNVATSTAATTTATTTATSAGAATPTAAADRAEQGLAADASAPEASAPAAPVAVPAPETAASTVVTARGPLTQEEAEVVIAGARARIDGLDVEILDLLRRRVAVSAEVQAARIAVGGPRLSLTREMEILDRYRAQFGAPGTEIAMLLLELCRGRV